jgi:gluconolactonase
MFGKLRLAWIEALAHDMRRDLQQMRPPVTVLVSGYDSPEGPAFDRDGNLYFVNWLSSSIVRLTPDGVASEFFNTGGIPAGLAFHRDGSLYVADEGDDIHGVLRVANGRMTILVNEFAGQPLNGANDLVFDSNGVLYFSDPWRSSAENSIGGFYRLFPDGRLERIDHGLAFPNGVALSVDGTAVYLAVT